MDRRSFLKTLTAGTPLLASGCMLSRLDELHVLFRSDVITSMEDEERVLKKAKVERTEDGRIRVLYVQGTPYERGYQHGKLLRKEVQENIGYLYEQAKAKFHIDEMFAEVYERQRPFIPQEYVDEMRGLAHGSRLPLHVIHSIHVLPEITEWGGKKRLRGVIKQMLSGELATSCSNFSAFDTTTDDHGFYAVRILDWGLHKISRLHEYALITVCRPDHGVPSANISWVGFLGAISGMNAQGITLGEMGYGDPPNETLHGEPMPFMLRDVMTYSSSLSDVRRILRDSPGTHSFVFLMSDGKTQESELYIKDHDRFVVFRPGQELIDGEESLPPIGNTVYGGHYRDRMKKLLAEYYGKLSPEVLMNTIIPQLAMPSNFQTVVYDPGHLTFWVANAKSKSERAAEQPYSRFDLGRALERFPAA